MTELQINHILKNCLRLGIAARSVFNAKTYEYEILMQNGTLIDDYYIAVMFINRYAKHKQENSHFAPDLMLSVMQEISGKMPACA